MNTTSKAPTPIPDKSAEHRRGIGSISFVIRTYNEEAFIGRLLKTLDAQQGVVVETEVVIVDSGSTDDTVRIAQQWPIKLVSIRSEEFNYATALNLGIEHSHGEIVAILSAHSIPCDANWLSMMITHFEDESVAGVFSRETPWPDADWREVRRLRVAFPEHIKVYEGTADTELVAFSNAASCIRRTVWESHPFVRLPYAEDREWAKWVVSRGLKVIYEARACVFHSHNENCRQVARRLINIEKAADLEQGRPRTWLLTMRQAIGIGWRDLREVLRLKDPKPNRVRLVSECFARAFWFLREFKQ